MTKTLGIIGCTGSVGTSAIKVISAYPNSFKLKFLAGHTNVKLLAKQGAKLNPEYLIIKPELIEQLRQECTKYNYAPCILPNQDLDNIIPQTQSILLASAGIEALHHLLLAIQHHKVILLANKEALICGGHLVTTYLKNSQAKIIPVDSEHNAIYQVIQQTDINNLGVDKIVITASGGPFYELSDQQLQNVSTEQALNHPRWSMGKVISVNSATLVNKALEVAEAY